MAIVCWEDVGHSAPRSAKFAEVLDLTSLGIQRYQSVFGHRLLALVLRKSSIENGQDSVACESDLSSRGKVRTSIHRLPRSSFEYGRPQALCVRRFFGSPGICHPAGQCQDHEGSGVGKKMGA